MARIDIRNAEDEILEIQFSTRNSDDYLDTATFLCANEELHPNEIFIEADNGEFLRIKRKDVGYLIKALEKAQEIWK